MAPWNAWNALQRAGACDVNPNPITRQILIPQKLLLLQKLQVPLLLAELADGVRRDDV